MLFHLNTTEGDVLLCPPHMAQLSVDGVLPDDEHGPLSLGDVKRMKPRPSTLDESCAYCADGHAAPTIGTWCAECGANRVQCKHGPAAEDSEESPD